MSEDTSVPWKGAGHIKHSRGTSCYYFFFPSLRVWRSPKKLLSLPRKGVLWIIFIIPAHLKTLLCYPTTIISVSPRALEPPQAGRNSAVIGTFWVPVRGTFPADGVSGYIIASKRFLPRATFLPITTPPWAF